MKYLFKAEFDIFWVPFNEYIEKLNEEYYANKRTTMKGLGNVDKREITVFSEISFNEQ